MAIKLLLGVIITAVMLLPLLGPILAVLVWPIVAFIYVWNGLFGTYIVVEGQAGRGVYFVKRFSVAELQEIVEKFGLDQRR